MPVNRSNAKPEIVHYIKFALGRQDTFYVGGLGDEENDWSPNKADAKTFKVILKAKEVCDKVISNGATVALKMLAKKHQRRRVDR